MKQSRRSNSKLKAAFTVFNEYFYKKYKKWIVAVLGIFLIFLGISSFKVDYNWDWSIVPTQFFYYGEDPNDKGLREKIATVLSVNDESVQTQAKDQVKTISLTVKAIKDVKIDQDIYIWLLTPKHSDVFFVVKPSQIKGEWKKGNEITISGLKKPVVVKLTPLTEISLQKVGWHTGPLLRGTFLTIFISLVSIVIAVILGTIFGLWRVSSSEILRFVSKTYVEIIRGTPLLVQLYVFYFFLGKVLNLSNIQAGIAALSFFAGAYVAEIIRAGIQSIPKGQMEASRAIGMNYFQAMRHIILPQAFRRILPPLAGQFISLIKDSSLVSIISLSDLTFSAQQTITTTFATFEIWFTVAGVYLLLTSILSWATHYLERRLLV